MRFDLESADLEIQEKARLFARDQLAPHARASDEERRFDATRVPLLGAAAMLGGHLPREYGGAGWTRLQWALAQIELGRVDSSWRGFCTVQGALCGQLISDHGTEAQKRELLPPLCAGEWIFAYALTEPEAGTDVASLNCRARRDGDGFIIKGTKVWITSGGAADRILVFATVDPNKGRDGITCFLIPGDASGLERKPMEGRELGHRGSNHATLKLHGVRVPESAVVGGLGRGFKVAMSALDHGRLGVAAGGVGIQQACHDACLEFTRQRRQFGRRIGDFQLIQAALAEIHVGLEATRLLTLHAAWLRDQGRANTREVSVAKYAASEAAVRAADQAVLLHGSRGYSSAWPVERYLRDAKGLQIYEGTSHIQRIIIARDLLGKEAR
jgi:alkylation response protein AidB-like acyl-CoA dehydrogenase